MLRFGAALVVVLGVVGFARAKDEEKPRIDVVFCIDCSGSMGGVIETAKQKVWEIVNTVAKARPVPELRIGLIGYGDSDRTFRTFALSSDLDEVYKNLVTFKDEGWGTEFVGLAVHKAVDEMKWAPGDKTLKVIFVVGNETARQGPAEFDYTKTAEAAMKQGIVVNAVYCGDTDYVAATPTWKEMAKVGAGRYMEIAGQGGGIVVATAYDKDLADLSGKLNTTYIGYGLQARERQTNQSLQDVNAVAVGGTTVAAARAYSKSTSLYNNADWDLVDAAKRPEFKLAEVKESELPEEMQKMSADERVAYVEKKGQEREEIQRQIKELAAKREVVVQEELKKRGAETQKAFDENVRKAIVEQAGGKGFKFEG